MSSVYYCLHGIIPSKKNSRISTKSGRTFPSKKYKERHDKSRMQLIQQCADYSTLISLKDKKVLKMSCMFFTGSKRLRDLSNKFESIADLFVDIGILSDDNYSILPEINLKWAGYEKGVDLCKITIDYE